MKIQLFDRVITITKDAEDYRTFTIGALSQGWDREWDEVGPHLSFEGENPIFLCSDECGDFEIFSLQIYSRYVSKGNTKEFGYRTYPLAVSHISCLSSELDSIHWFEKEGLNVK
jgi:hypothetical protein